MEPCLNSLLTVLSSSKKTSVDPTGFYLIIATSCQIGFSVPFCSVYRYLSIYNGVMPLIKPLQFESIIT